MNWHLLRSAVPRRDLGLEPHILGEAIVDSLLEFVIEYKDRVNMELIKPAGRSVLQIPALTGVLCLEAAGVESVFAGQPPC